MLWLTLDSSRPTDDPMAPAHPVPAPRTFWQRVGAGTFGGGVLGLFGLLSGFLVPVATLCIRIAQGPTQNYDQGGLPFTELLELLFALFFGLAQGVVGLILGLIAGFVSSALGPTETKPRRMCIALVVLLIAALISAVYLALFITAPSPTPLV